MADIPFELIEDILRRPPVKTLKRFRAVAKSWRYLIDSEQFVKSHMHQSLISNSPRNLIIGGFGAYSIDLDCLDKADVIKAPFNYDHVGRISGSCNGMVLVESKTLVLWNPFSRDHKVLPKLPVVYPVGLGSICQTEYGFGYDSRNDDYKVVCALHFWVEGIGDWMYPETWIYGLKSNCWRKLEDFPYQLPILTQHFGLHVNGALVTHSEERGRMRILAFSVESEEHYEVMVPRGIEMNGAHFSFSVFDGCLCLVCFCRQTKFVIWVMKEFGVAESWTELFSVSICPPTITKDDYVVPIVYSRERDKILLNCYDEKLLWYDLSCGTVENVEVDGMPYDFDAQPCVETLFPPWLLS